MAYITPGGRVGNAAPLGKKPGPRGLTDYTRAIARALMRKHPEWTLSHAIAVARSQQRKWIVGKDTSPAVRAGAARSLAKQAILDHRKRGKRS